MLNATQPFDPVRIAFGATPICRKCNSTLLRIDYARDLLTRQLHVGIVCRGHRVHRAVNLERIVAAERGGNRLIDAIVNELRRRFGDVLTTAATPAAVPTEIVRRPIVCGGCGAPSDPADPECGYCHAQLAGVSRG